MLKYITLPLLILLLFSCEKTVAGDSDFARMYVELRVAAQEFGDTETGDAERQKIFEKHNSNAQKFEAELSKIRENADDWKVFQKSVMDVLDIMNKENADGG